jgi:chorismate-pyruvate lyase
MDIVSRLIHLEESTTSLLESLRGAPLRLVIESQKEIQDQQETIIKRTVKLFFESSDEPVLFAVSYLYKSNLHPNEYKLLRETELQIFRVFQRFNDASLIRKRNISITNEVSNEFTATLNVSSPAIFRKRYDFWVGDREIGSISEFFNEESLMRIWHTKNIEI